MQILTSVKQVLTFLAYASISVLCILYAFQKHHGSHFDSLVTASPLSGIFALLILALIFFTAFLKNSVKLPFLLFLLMSGSFFGESFYRITFHLILLSLTIQCLFFDGKKISSSISSSWIYLFSFIFFLVYLSGLSTALWFELDSVLLLDMFMAQSSLNSILRESSIVSYLPETVYVIEFISLGVFTGMLLRLFSYNELKTSFAKSLAFCILLLPLFLLFQIYDFHPLFRVNQNEFWSFSARYSGMFSDPNAFGIMSGLILLLVPYLYHNPMTRIILSCLLIFSSMFSGSRTFFIFLFVYLLPVAVSYISGVKWNRRYFAAISALILVSALLILIIKPPSINRFYNYSDSSRIESLFQSRIIFNRIALQAITEFPFHGLGLGRFYSEQERISDSIGIELSGWRDNANNYYLHIAAEQGISGLLMIIYVLLSVFLLKPVTSSRNSEADNLKISACEPDKTPVGRYIIPDSAYIKGVLIVFLFSLLTGPHLFFSEVRCLFFILAGLVCISGESRNSSVKRFTYMILFFISVCIIVSPWWYRQEKSQGLYGEEVSGEERFQWTGSMADIALSGQQKDKFKIKNPLHGFLSEYEQNNFLTVRFLSSESETFQEYRIPALHVADKWYSILIPEGADRCHVIPPGTVIPKKADISEDDRVLGVQISY